MSESKSKSERGASKSMNETETNPETENETITKTENETETTETTETVQSKKPSRNTKHNNVQPNTPDAGDQVHRGDQLPPPASPTPTCRHCRS
ncbi:hypothetical protein BD311DRAFT_759939 [Dichomitus squalens]|uniref:Uncharacterized protein n=1 Tax=Dichomitus squalens TaxID=114155 RepID=A0A4Q9MMY4_9APHY|nr:hypothetical protein BD311DRAFT_759939 [Dichomitus squalens]